MCETACICYILVILGSVGNMYMYFKVLNIDSFILIPYSSMF